MTWVRAATSLPRLTVALPLFVLVAGLDACASAPSRDVQIRAELARGRYREAAEAAARDGDELLRHLDRGLALHYAGDARASNLYLARAEQLVEERWTRSLSRAALSLLLNDTVLPYQPDVYERLLIPLYRALNHVTAGEAVDAAVEARRLAALVLQRRDAQAAAATAEGIAFLCVVAGVLAEWAGEPVDARVAYRLAVEIDPATSAWIGDTAALSGSGELVLLVEGGFVAPLVEERVFFLLDETDLALGRADPLAAGEEMAKRYLARRSGADPDAGRDVTYLLPLVLPRRPLPAVPPTRVTVVVDGRGYEVPVAFDVSRAAALAYESELPRLLAKTVARTLVKTLAFKETTEDAGTVVRVLANALHVASERADTRAWLTLPGELRFLRVPLPPGAHDVELSVAGGFAPQTLELGEVTVSGERPTIVAVRYY